MEWSEADSGYTYIPLPDKKLTSYVHVGKVLEVAERISLTDDEQIVPRTDELKERRADAALAELDTNEHIEDGKDAVRDTTTLSKDNAMLKRAISQQNVNSFGTATLGERREIILLIRGMVERIVISDHAAFKLGRFDLTNKADNEVDLTPYGAMDRGVSRLHAQLHLEEDKLFITDLGSTNGTYLGGDRLDPHTPALLRKGDELLVGRLQIQVLFR